ncbi:MAG: hypothetical protein QOJ03_2261, partial [Frankiaceae bacterium]|nr:hypothetical protein [Frankiaceae bacterium]
NVDAKNPNDEGNVSIVGLLLSVIGVAVAILIFVRTERRRSRRRTKVSDNVDPRVREVR